MKNQPVRLAIGGMLALAAGMGIGRFVYTPILPPMADGLGLTSTTAGLIASANFFGYLAGALLASLPALSRKRLWLLVALVVNAVAMQGMGHASSVWMFLGLRCIGGVASAFILVFSWALVLDGLAAARRDELSAVHAAGVGVGIMLSAALVAVLSAMGFGWRELWFGSAALALVAALGVAVLVSSDASTQSAAGSGGSPRIAGSLTQLIWAYGLFGFGYVITATFLVAIVHGSPDIAKLEPIIWILFGFAAAPSVALWTWLGSRMGVLSAFAVACLAEAVGVAASVLWVATPGLILSAFLLGGTFTGIASLGLIAARAMSAGDPRRALAAVTAAFGAGQIIGPVFAGWIRDMTGSFAVPSLCAAGALVLAAFLSQRQTVRAG